MYAKKTMRNEFSGHRTKLQMCFKTGDHTFLFGYA